jgi:hypothetical protein
VADRRPSTRRRVSSTPSPIVTSRRNTCRATSCSAGRSASWVESASRASAPPQTTDAAVPGERQRATRAGVEALREGVLEQRERAGSIGDLGDELGGELGCHRDPDPRSWPDARALELGPVTAAGR